MNRYPDNTLGAAVAEKQAYSQSRQSDLGAGEGVGSERAEIQQWLGRLAAQLQALHGYADTLESRLSPVLASSGPAKELERVPTQVAQAPMSESIAQMLEVANEAGRRMNDIHQRLRC